MRLGVLVEGGEGVEGLGACGALEGARVVRHAVAAQARRLVVGRVTQVALVRFLARVRVRVHPQQVLRVEAQAAHLWGTGKLVNARKSQKSCLSKASFVNTKEKSGILSEHNMYLDTFLQWLKNSRREIITTFFLTPYDNTIV